MGPAAAIAWKSTQQLSITLAVAVATPLLAILQGTVGILTYRALYGDAPLPQAPSHGLIVVSPDDKAKDDDENCSGILVEDETCNVALDLRNETLQLSQQENPLRLLVIGDSLAIGVGQQKSALPVIPQAIGKTLSKQLGGRIVLWTCHGAPGASTGWIVREIERGGSPVQSTLSDRPAVMAEDVGEAESDDSSTEDHLSLVVDTQHGAVSSLEGQSPNPSLAQWRERLRQHRKSFDDPDSLGPYDIVVVLTGSNDLKSAFFPFLLTGEDVKFRREARQRGGSYPKELMRLVDTLNNNMPEILQTFRQRVDSATETLIGKVEETIKYISPTSSSHLTRTASTDDETSKFFDENDGDTKTDSNLSRRRPLVVLPGMPARSLPIFQIAPLRWLAIPIVDIMDMHKRKFANCHQGEVLFVPPPSMRDLSEYEHHIGEVWDRQTREDTLMSLQDIRRKEHSRIGDAMEKYYEHRQASKTASIWSRMFGTGYLSQLFSVDGVHPRDEGYEFWGRYIGDSIAKELQQSMS